MSTKSKDAKTIATLDINILTSPTYKELFLDDQNHCPLCGDELIFTHVTQFLENTVSEEAHCESCKIRVKNNSHSLQ